MRTPAQRRRTRRGVSLIEVLVVLVILVLGILTIIRLFPSGFFSVESVGNAALADSLGIAAVQAQTQDTTGLPDAILPGIMDALGNPKLMLSDGQFDPDKAENLDGTSSPAHSAHVVHNETLTVPSARTANGSVYVVKYGPVRMGDGTFTTDPATDVSKLSEFVAINGTYWAPLDGNPTAQPTSPFFPQDTLANAAPQSYLVDLANKKIAVPYAPYALTNSTTTPATYTSYDQRMVVIIFGDDGQQYKEYLDVPPATTQDSVHPRAPKDGGSPEAYLSDTAANYQGGWFDPTSVYPDPSVGTPQTSVPATTKWLKVWLYRPFTPVLTGATPGANFGLDPYQFKLLNPNITSTTAGVVPGNLGAIAFNPLGAGRMGIKPLTAQVTYQIYSWRILHEDRDIAPPGGVGNSTVTRLTLKNLRRVGDADPENNIDTGFIPGSSVGFIIEDLDTGLPISGTLIDEDTNGTSPAATSVNLSYAVGRLTFASNAFGDNPTGNTPHTHRLRIYYAGDAGWTVAVQKASAYYSDASATAGTMGILPGQFAFDGTSLTAYFPQSESNRTVAFEGTYMDSTGLKSFALTGVIGNQLYPFAGGNYVRVTLNDSTEATPVLPATATIVTFGAVRGLSARAVVAWKERDLWKVHTVDTVLTRTP